MHISFRDPTFVPAGAQHSVLGAMASMSKQVASIAVCCPRSGRDAHAHRRPWGRAVRGSRVCAEPAERPYAISPVHNQRALVPLESDGGRLGRPWQLLPQHGFSQT